MLNFINDNDNLILLRDFILSINKHCDYNSKRIYYSCPYQNKFKKIHNKIIFNYIDNSYSYIYGIYVDNNKIEPQKNYKIEIKNNLKLNKLLSSCVFIFCV